MSAINNLPGLAKFNNATHDTDGLMSRNDKQKLDSLHKPDTVNAILYTSEWSINRPYTQTINIPDITSKTNGSLTIDPIATEDEINACMDADIMISEQSMNCLVVQANGEKPTIDIPVVVVFGENLAVITSSKIVDTGNTVRNLVIQPTDWVVYEDTYKTTLNVPGITESMVGSISMKSELDEAEVYQAAKARIEILNTYDDTVELIIRGERPSIPLHMVLYYGPSISIVRKPVFGGKITPEAQYQVFNDYNTGLGVTNTQSAIEEIVNNDIGLMNKPTHFKTVSTMKESMNLKVGQLVRTSGYRTENDGGGATYIITSNSLKTDNGASVHVLKNGLRAEIVLALGEDINLKCFGLYADGIHDDSPVFNKGFDFCKEINGGTIRWQGTAALNEPLVVDSHYINIQGYGYGSKLKANFERDYVLSVSYEEHSTTEEIQQILIGNFRIDGNEKAKHGLVVDDNLPVYNSIFENIYISNTKDYGLIADCCTNNHFNLITLENCNGGIEVIGTTTNCKFDTCQVKGTSNKESLILTVHENNEITERPSLIDFNNCYFGNSPTTVLVKVKESINVSFERCVFDLQQTLSNDYPIIINEYSLYTRFNNCFLNGRDKTCGIINNNGVDTEIRNFIGIDMKSTHYHVLTTNTMNVSNFKLIGDSTPLVIYTPNDNKTILDVDTIIKTVNDDSILFPSNANFYNLYMNQQDKLGVKGKLNDYIIDKYVENERINIEKVIHDSKTFNHQIELPLPGVWEVDMLLNIDDGNQGKICKYQVAFKQNSVYSVANIQKITEVISWGTNINMDEPTITKLGILTFKFNDKTSTNRSTWSLKIKAKRINEF